ncbi:hypothetical protein C0J52_27777 [Blattella germanica]|nr:hypothetical protein C0J52_27777 [Blattella germanica]
MLANYATRTFILHFHVTYFYIFLHIGSNVQLNALDKQYNLKYHSMFYIFKVKLISTQMGYIFTF